MFNSVHHIAIIVSDLKTAKEFYCGKLGFEIVRENIRNEKNDIKLDLKINENTELEIFVKKDAPERPSPEAMGLRHLAFKVDNIYDVVKYLEGNHIEGLFLSREIIQNTKQPYIKAGAYYTITFNSMLLGLSSSAFEALENVKKIALEDPIHAEDYNLMACYLQMHIYHEISTISNVNPQKLSSDAINMYDLMLQLSRLITNVQRTNTEIRQAMLVCRRYELLHIPALELELNGIMAGIFTKEPDMLDSYLSKMVNIAEKNKWYSILAKYAYFYNNKETISLLEKRSSSGLKKYLSLRDKNSKNWLILFKEARRGIPDSFSFEDTEIIILLSYNLTNEEISTLMNRPKEEISRHIHQLCKKLGLKTKKELIEHYTLRS